MKRNHWPYLLPILLVTIWWLVLRVSEIGFFLKDNNADFFLPSYLHNYWSLIKFGQLPLVNYHQLLGNVHLGQGQTGVLSPLVYLGFTLAGSILGSEWFGIDVIVLIHWYLAVLGMVVLLRSQKITWWWAIIGSLVWVTMPYGVGVGRYWVVVVYLVAYLPWGYWSIIKYWHQPTSKRVVIMGLVRWLLVLQGYVQWVVMAGFIEFLFVWLNNRSQKRWYLQKQFFYYLGMWMAVGLVSLPLLWPLWRTGQRSVARQQPLSYSDFIDHSISPEDWARAQLLEFTDDTIFDGSTYIYHWGLVLICLWIFTTWQKTKHNTSKLSNSNVLAGMMLVSLMCTTALYGFAYWIPFLNLFRWPFKYLIMAEFFFIWSLIVNSQWWVKKFPQSQPVIAGLLIIGLITNVWVILKHRGVEDAFSTNQLTQIPLEASWQDIVDPNQGRLFTFAASLDSRLDQSQLGGYNFATLMSKRHFGGYDATLAYDLWQTIRGTPVFGAPATEFNSQMIEYLASWGVRYWITGNSSAVQQLVKGSGRMETIWSNDTITIIEDKQSRPYVYDANYQAVGHVFGVNSITAYPKSPGEIVFNVFSWPEYRAYIDGQEVPLINRDNRPVVSVTQANQQVVLRFVDREFNWGIKFMLGTIVVTLVWWLYRFNLTKLWSRT